MTNKDRTQQAFAIETKEGFWNPVSKQNTKKPEVLYSWEKIFDVVHECIEEICTDKDDWFKVITVDPLPRIEE